MGFDCGFILHNKKIEAKDKDSYKLSYIYFLDWGRISNEIDTSLTWLGESIKKYPIVDYKENFVIKEEKGELINYNGRIVIKASKFIEFGLRLETLAHFINRFSDRVQNEISEYDFHSLKKSEKVELEDIMFHLKDDLEYEDIFFAERIYIAAKFLSEIENIDDTYDIIYYRSY